jgi:hypothetical protein
MELNESIHAIKAWMDLNIAYSAGDIKIFFQNKAND